MWWGTADERIDAPVGMPATAPDRLAAPPNRRRDSPRSSLSKLAVTAADGDPHALDELLRRVRTMVLRYCRSRLGSMPGAEQTAEDAAQEACLNVIDILPKYRWVDGPFEALVYTLASRRVADQQRVAYRIPVPVADLPDDAEVAPSPEELAVASEDAEQARQLLATLPESHRELLTLRIAVGMSSDEVAAAMGMSPGAVRVAQHRALQKLRAVVEGGHASGGHDD